MGVKSLETLISANTSWRVGSESDYLIRPPIEYNAQLTCKSSHEVKGGSLLQGMLANDASLPKPC